MSIIRNLQIWAPAANSTIPFRQVVTGFEAVFEDEIIQRINRERVITALADPRHGEAPPLLNDVRAAVEAIELPEGYRLEWWGEYKSSGDAQAALAGTIPVFIVMNTIGPVTNLRSAMREKSPKANNRSAKNIRSWWWCMTANPPVIVFLLWSQNTDYEAASEHE